MCRVFPMAADRCIGHFARRQVAPKSKAIVSAACETAHLKWSLSWSKSIPNKESDEYKGVEESARSEVTFRWRKPTLRAWLCFTVLGIA